MNFFLSYQLALTIIFTASVLLHLVRRNIDAVYCYALESFGVVLLLLRSWYTSRSSTLLALILLTFIIKVIFAPYFFSRFVKRHQVVFSSTTYLKIPLTLIVLTLLTAFAESSTFVPLSAIRPEYGGAITLSLAIMFSSVFLLVNRKGALAQLLGILSLENAIVTFAIFAGLEQSFALQLGILFDIFVWLTISVSLASMIYRHFGSLDVSSMNTLID